jgi:2-haloacid dehalogenase
MRNINMPITLAFDVYGTLINTSGVIVELEKHIGDKAPEFSRIWREKQLEYSFRRGLMQNYQNFPVCTRNALDYTSSFFKVSLNRQAREDIINAYKTLPAFGDVKEGLNRAKERGLRMFAFSNGVADDVERLLTTAGIRDFFLGVVSVDDLKSFKPDPAVYDYFLKRSGAASANAWLISSNPFDVIGAISSGMHAAWVQRSPEAVFDPWGIEPTITLTNLSDLADKITKEVFAERDADGKSDNR